MSCGCSDCSDLTLAVGADGAPGADGNSQYVYIGYAEDAFGTGYSTTPTPTSTYIGILVSTTAITPVSGDFLWTRYQGVDGAAGTPGSVWRTGSGVPSNGLGVDGDFYVDTTTVNGDGDIAQYYYLKVAGAYVLQGQLRGAKGAQCLVDTAAWVDISSTVVMRRSSDNAIVPCTTKTIKYKKMGKTMFVNFTFALDNNTLGDGASVRLTMNDTNFLTAVSQNFSLCYANNGVAANSTWALVQAANATPNTIGITYVTAAGQLVYPLQVWNFSGQIFYETTT